MTFNRFLNEQIDRMDAVPGFQMSDAGRKELALWLADQGSTPLDRRKFERGCVAEFLRDSDLCRRIKATLDECVEFTTPPGLSDIKAVWYRLYPPSRSHERCAVCDGTGYVIVRRGDAEGAKRCGGVI
jgi:hypothetical protein